MVKETAVVDEEIRWQKIKILTSYLEALFLNKSKVYLWGNCSPLLGDLFSTHCEFRNAANLFKKKKFGFVELFSYFHVIL